MALRFSLRHALLLLLLLALAMPLAASPTPPSDDTPVPEHSDEEVQEAREEFESIDTNKVSRASPFRTLLDVLDHVHMQHACTSFCKGACGTAPRWQDGFISREEILEMDEVPEREEIDEFFSTYDTNGDGRVTFEEILDADESVRTWSPFAVAQHSQLLVCFSLLLPWVWSRVRALVRVASQGEQRGCRTQGVVSKRSVLPACPQASALPCVPSLCRRAGRVEAVRQSAHVLPDLEALCTMKEKYTKNFELKS